MGVQEDACWRCGVTPAPEPGAAALRVIQGGAAAVVQPPADPAVSTADRLARLVAEARA
jgi:hypothetical protein